MSNREHVTLELKCCCCGKVMDTLMTGWFADEVRAESIWTRRPCEPCEVELAAVRFVTDADGHL